MKYVEGLVSVIMPTYKRSEMLSRAIESILSQSYTNLELLLINDNEPDDEYTNDLIGRIEKYLSDPRFKLVMQQRHTNGAVARNLGIKQAKGEFIAFLDDDDWWEKDKIKQQVRVLRSLDDTWGGVSCKFTLYDQNGAVIGRTSKYNDGYIYKDILNLISDVATGTLLLRHSALDDAGYFDESLLRHQDLQLLVNFTSKYKLMEVDKYLHCVDVSDAQNRPNPEKMIRQKEAFFKSIQVVMNSLTVSERNCVYAMHRFELGYVYLKQGTMSKGLYCCAKVFCSPRVLLLAIKKVWLKIQQKYHASAKYGFDDMT